MSLITRIISALFQRAPRYEVSAYRDLYMALCDALYREGVNVGSTAGYPRVEINTIRENERLDKEGALRQVTVIVDSISNRKLGDAITMNEANLRLLTEHELQITGWNCLGVLPTQLQDLTETSDSNKIIYRLAQEFTIYLEKVKTEPTPDPEPAPDPESGDEPIEDEPAVPADPQDPEPGEPGSEEAEQENN